MKGVGCTKDVPRSYRVSRRLSIRLFESPAGGQGIRCERCGEGEFWNVVWPSGLVLARYLARRVLISRVKGIRVLALGCGVGLEGLVLAKLGAVVCFLDHISEALELVERNARLNGVGPVETVVCCFREATRSLKRRKFDLVVGSDVLYVPRERMWIERLLRGVMKRNGIGIFSDPNRKTGVVGFFRILSRTGFRVRWQPNPPEGTRSDQTIRIYLVERR